MRIYKIITDERILKNPCKPCETVEEGNDIGRILKVVLDKNNDGVGLAANQIGIQKNVCLINVKKPIVLVNPKIVGKFSKFLYKEGCLSFPGEYIITERYKNIVVKTDNHKNLITFSSETKENMLECACVQHEIDHLNGKTMYDRAPPLASRKIADLLIKGLKNGK